MASDEKIIPEKKFAFQTPSQPRRIQTLQKKTPKRVQPEIRKIQQKPDTEKIQIESPVQFNIPQAANAQTIQTQIFQQRSIPSYKPPQRNNWRKWIIAIAIILLVIALGLYFLVL